MSSSYITISYHIISYVFLFYLFCWFDLHSIPFYSTLFQIDLILFYFILLNLIYYIVQYCISHINEWMIWIYLPVHPSVCLSDCLFICMNKFIFSLLSCFFILSLLFLFSFSFLFLYSFLMNVFLTHTRTRTHTYIWIYIPSYDSYILLQKEVSEESYSSDSIISYLI